MAATTWGSPMTTNAAAERARALYAQARDCDDARTKAALVAASAAWARIAKGPADNGWSDEPLKRAVIAFKREVVCATGPFRRPEPPARGPSAPPPAQEVVQRVKEEVAIPF